MPIAYRSVLTSGIVAESLTIANLPTTTTYAQLDTLDTTGLVVNAVVDNVSRDVTSRCTIIPKVLNTAGTQTISVLYGGKLATFDVTVEAFNSISITTPPKTAYAPNTQLDLTGIVVTGITNSFTRDITQLCTFSPEDGTALTTEGTFNLTAYWGNLTSTIQYSVATASVYGVEWDGNSSPTWIRTDDSASFGDPQPYYSGMSETPTSPFDNLMPWSGMEIVNDADLGELVKIPKFWYKWTRSGKSMKLQIADKEKDGFYVSPAHADRGDGFGERDIVYVGRYFCADTTYKSSSGVVPQTSKTIEEFRTSIHNLHTKAWIYDFAMYWTICMLYLVEFASWNSQSKIGGGCSETEASSHTRAYNMGSTDSMPYHTGTTSSSIGDTVYGANQYRYIENLWGNVWCIVDGIYYSEQDVYCIKNPADFSNTGGTFVGTRSSNSGPIREWSNPSVDGFEYALIPFATNNNYDYTVYSCDGYTYSSTGKIFYTGGNYSGVLSHGLFYSSCGAFNYTYKALGTRLMKLP